MLPSSSLLMLWLLLLHFTFVWNLFCVCVCVCVCMCIIYLFKGGLLLWPAQHTPLHTCVLIIPFNHLMCHTCKGEVLTNTDLNKLVNKIWEKYTCCVRRKSLWFFNFNWWKMCCVYICVQCDVHSDHVCTQKQFLIDHILNPPRASVSQLGCVFPTFGAEPKVKAAWSLTTLRRCFASVSRCLYRAAGWSTPSVRRWPWRGTGVRLRPKPWRTNCSFTSRARRSPAGESAGWRRRTELREPPCTSDQRRVSLRATVQLLNSSSLLGSVGICLCFSRFEQMEVSNRNKVTPSLNNKQQQTGLWVSVTSATSGNCQNSLQFGETTFNQHTIISSFGLKTEKISPGEFWNWSQLRSAKVGY